MIPSFHTNYPNSLFISANTYEKHIVRKEYSIAHPDDKMCFLPNFRYHILLLGGTTEFLKKLDALCFNYQHVDCPHTLFKFRFSSKKNVKSRQLFDNVQRAVHFNHENTGADRMTSIAKKTLQEKVRKTFVKLLPKDENRRKLVDQSSQTEMNKLKRIYSN